MTSLLPTRRMGPLDPILVTVVAMFSGYLNGSRTWAGFNSPDSEFYATLALFGHEVTDRAIEPGYFWTRLGYIAPVRALTSVLGPWNGFAAWRFILIWLIAFSVACVVLRYSNRSLALIAAALVTSNTMILSYVGNTYVTGTVLAALCVLIACGIWGMAARTRMTWLPAGCAGATIAWLAMLNPYGCLLGIATWIALRAIAFTQHSEADSQPRWTSLRRDAVAVTGFGAVTFAAFLLLGRVMFREFEWFSTYLYWNSRLNQADFASDPLVWTHDRALAVPALALGAGLAVCLISHWRPAALVGFLLACVTVGFALLYVLVSPGPTLESSYYIAMLWPAALMSLALSAAALSPPSIDRASALILIAVGSGCVLVSIRAGASQDPFSANAAIAWVLLWTGVFALAAVVWQRLSGQATTRLIAACSAVGVVALGGSMTTAQYLQNGRGSIGWFSQYPFASAYVDFGAEDAMRTKVRVQQWLLDRTSPVDTIAVWTDPDRMLSSVAAMQLWGADNLVTGAATLGRDDINRLQSMRPTVIAMYAPTREQIVAFHSSIPAWARPSPLECMDVRLPDARAATSTACITRLDWLT